MRFNFSIFLILLTCFSCATSKKDNSKDNPRKLSSVKIEVDRNLSQAVAKALKEGDDRVLFLSNDLFLKASAAMMESNYESANLIFKHLVKLVPTDTYINTRYAVSLIRTGKLEEAEVILSSLYKNNKSLNKETSMLLAGLYSSLGRLEQSQVIYKKIVKEFPKDQDACVFLAKSYAVSKKTSKAVSLLKKCERKHKKTGIFSYYIGKLYLDKQKYKTAKNYFNRALRKEPSFTQAALASGLVLEELGKPEKALVVYEKFLKTNSTDRIILSRYVQLLFSFEEYDKVIPYAEALSDIEPDNLNLKVKLGILYNENKQFDDAISIFKNLLVDVPKNDKVLYYLGAIYQEVGKLEDSIHYFSLINTNSALYQDSSVQVAHMLSALASSEKSNESEKKFVSYTKAKINELPDFKVELALILVDYYEGIRDIDLAVTLLEGISDDSKFNNDHKYYLASLYEKQEDYKKSQQIIWEVIDSDPENAHAWNFLGYSMLMRSKEYPKAFKYLSKAQTLKPNDGYILDSIGWYYYKVGEIAKAIEKLEKANKLEPEDLSIKKHLVIVYSKMKKFSKAKTYLMQALEFARVEAERGELYEALKMVEANRLPASLE